MSPKSCVFRLFARGCRLRHTARTLHSEINVRVSRGADNCHIPRQGPAAFKRNQRETVWSLAVLTYQANWLFGNRDPSSVFLLSSSLIISLLLFPVLFTIQRTDLLTFFLREVRESAVPRRECRSRRCPTRGHEGNWRP